MAFSVKKSVSERYDLRWEHCGWATIIIDEKDGSFNCQSDYGNYSYSWGCHGRKSFKHYIAMDLAKDTSYFLGKVSKPTYFNYEENLKQWKKTIIEYRRDWQCTKEEAREAWDFIIGLNEYSNSYHAIQMKIFETNALNGISEEPWYLFETILNYPPQAVMFAEKVLPMFAEVLKEEIAPKQTKVG